MRGMHRLRALPLAGLVALLVGLFAQGASAETLRVSNTKPVSVRAKTVFNPSHVYRIVASGRVSDWPDDYPESIGDYAGAASWDGFGVDAIWCYADWRCGDGEPWRQLRVKRAADAWSRGAPQGLDELAGYPTSDPIPYNPAHRYVFELRSLKGRLDFATWDAFFLRSHASNKGSFKVTITDLGRSLPAISSTESFLAFLVSVERRERRIGRVVAQQVTRWRKARTARGRVAAIKAIRAQLLAYRGLRIQTANGIRFAWAETSKPSLLLVPKLLPSELLGCAITALPAAQGGGMAKQEAELGKLLRALRGRDVQAVRVRSRRLGALATKNRSTLREARECTIDAIEAGTPSTG